MSQISARLASVRSRIAAAAAADRRDAAGVTLIAVSKTFPPEAITPVLDAGQRVFGENRVQEAKAKWPALRARYPGSTLHLIGPLQSNKAKEAVALFDAIHTIDRPRIAEAIAAEMAKQGRCLQLFIEVNTGEEAQKAGVLPTETAGLLRLCREELKLDIAGLMCIPPIAEAPARAFCLSGQAGRRARSGRPQHGHERGLRNGDPVWRHACAHRLGNLWPTRLAQARSGARQDTGPQTAVVTPGMPCGVDKGPGAFLAHNLPAQCHLLAH